MSCAKNLSRSHAKLTSICHIAIVAVVVLPAVTVWVVTVAWKDIIELESRWMWLLANLRQYVSHLRYRAHRYVPFKTSQIAWSYRIYAIRKESSLENSSSDDSLRIAWCASARQLRRAINAVQPFNPPFTAFYPYLVGEWVTTCTRRTKCWCSASWINRIRWVCIQAASQKKSLLNMCHVFRLPSNFIIIVYLHLTVKLSI